jgi:hypothetical protein
MKSTVAIGLVVIIAVAAGAAYLFTSGYGAAQTGTVLVGVTDSPIPSNVTAIYLTITDISFQSTSNTSATFNVNSTQFNLLSLQNVTKMLGSNKLPVGNYTMIRFNVTSATATIAGSNHSLTVPSGVVKVALTSQKLQVKSGETTKIILDITPVMTRISSAYNLRPEVTVKSITGPS